VTRGTARAAAAAALLVGAAFAFQASAAQEGPAPAAGPSPSARFDALVAEIDRLRATLETIEGRERGVIGRLEGLDVQIALRTREMDRLAMMKEEATLERGALETRLGTVVEVTRGREAALARHLRETYMSGRGREMRLVIWADDPGDLLRSVTYLDALARRQGEALAQLRESRGALTRVERALKDQTASIEELVQRERQAAIALESARQEAAGLLRSIREEADVHRAAIDELTRAAEEMERAIVEGLRGGAHPAPVAIDLGKLKGAIEWPVAGKVAVPFGDIRHKAFGTVTPHPGIDIAVAPGAEVAVIAGGTVVFSRWFSGYGNTVLVDHGGGYLSIYAHLGAPRVAEGDEVLPRQILGLAADGQSGGAPAIYFEFRKDGKAVDPAGWLKREKAARASTRGR
jgi:septal ring factor EnvC (AmiA/AmiB activator)